MTFSRQTEKIKIRRRGGGSCNFKLEEIQGRPRRTVIRFYNDLVSVSREVLTDPFSVINQSMFSNV